MREIVFISKNEDRWRSIERHVSEPSLLDPDVLATEYVSVIDDLAYARARYPKSHTTVYLNQLAAMMHLVLTKNRRSYLRSAGHFWTHTIPASFVGIRKELLIVLVGFLFMAGVGYLAGLPSEDLARTIFGDGYVDMTIANIERGDPMGVYSSQDGLSMFVMIFYNNFQVMLFVVALGMIPIVGVMGSVVRHGLMLGAFHAMFARYDVLGTSLLVVWIHGAFEMSCLVVSAAAGLHAGLSYVNPGTFPRRTAFVLALRRSVTVAVGMIPFVFVAALLESFVTRWSTMPLALDLAIIILSLAIIWGYVVILPSYLFTSGTRHVRTLDPAA
jgi:uncharacterized membrane protein SpoIIM required for sporulation